MTWDQWLLIHKCLFSQTKQHYNKNRCVTEQENGLDRSGHKSLVKRFTEDKSHSSNSATIFTVTVHGATS